MIFFSSYFFYLIVLPLSPIRCCLCLIPPCLPPPPQKNKHLYICIHSGYKQTDRQVDTATSRLNSNILPCVVSLLIFFNKTYFICSFSLLRGCFHMLVSYEVTCTKSFCRKALMHIKKKQWKNIKKKKKKKKNMQETLNISLCHTTNNLLTLGLPHVEHHTQSV